MKEVTILGVRNEFLSIPKTYCFLCLYITLVNYLHRHLGRSLFLWKLVSVLLFILVASLSYKDSLFCSITL